MTIRTTMLRINAERVYCPFEFSQSRSTQIKARLNSAITESHVLYWMLSKPRATEEISTIQIMAERVRTRWFFSKRLKLFDMAFFHEMGG
jgi:hypothetical protein